LSLLLQGINVNCALLFLGTLAILLPSLLDETHSEVTERSSELTLSRVESIFLLLIYGAYLLFQLYTHRWELAHGTAQQCVSDWVWARVGCLIDHAYYTSSFMYSE
jgi:Ca2+/H+ antiporter